MGRGIGNAAQVLIYLLFVTDSDRPELPLALFGVLLSLFLSFFGFIILSRWRPVRAWIELHLPLFEVMNTRFQERHRTTVVARSKAASMQRRVQRVPMDGDNENPSYQPPVASESVDVHSVH